MISLQEKWMAILALTVTLIGYSEEPQAKTRQDADMDKNTDKWRVQVGWVHQWGRGMSVKSSPSSFSFSGGLPSLSGASELSYPGVYDDGYVLPDIWTDDDDIVVPPSRQGMTWNWGANNASQYNYDGGEHPTLTFHKDRGEYVGDAYSLRGDNSDDDIPADGLEIKFSRLLHFWTYNSGPTNNGANVKVALDLNVVFGVALFPGNSQKCRNSYGQDVFNVSETYTYLDYYGTVLGGSWPALVLPYAGSESTEGPLIPVTPESASQTSAYLGTYRDSVEIKSKLWRLRGVAGIELSKPLTERLDVFVSPQFVLEFLDMHAERTETFTFTDASSGASSTVASRRNRHSKMTVCPGALITVGANYRFGENWYAGADVGWEWLIDEPSLRVGADRVQYDLSGGEFSLYVGRRF